MISVLAALAAAAGAAGAAQEIAVAEARALAGEPTAALADVERALAAPPEVADLRAAVRVALLAGRDGRAEHFALRHAEAARDRAAALRALADDFRRLGRGRQAALWARSAWAFGGDDTAGGRFLGRTLLASGRAAEALALLAPEDRASRVAALRALGQADQACALAWDAWATSEEPAAAVALARCAAGASPGRARELIAQARARAREDAAPLVALADLFGAGESEPALSAWLRERPDAPGAAEVALRLGRLALDRGDRDGARRLLRLAAARDSDAGWAARTLLGRMR